MSTSSTSSATAPAPHLNYPWLAHYPKGVNWHQQIAPAPLYQLLERAADRHPARICTNFLGRTITYGEMSRLVDRAAAGLAAIGVTKGTKVGLFLPNSPTFILFYYATLKAGGTVVNYNPLYTLEELTFQVKDSDTDIMVTLDLKLLFDKVEALMVAGTLKRAIVASFPALLPTAKSILFRLFKGKDLASVKSSKVAGSIIAEDSILANGGSVRCAGDRSDRRRRGAAVHRRHDRYAQGRDADSCRRLHQRAADRGLGAGTQGSGGARPGRAAVLPRLRDDRRDELRHRQGGRNHHHAALRARRCAEADRQDQADDHAGRADAVQRGDEPSRSSKASISRR